jgi:hypothetical protein
MWPSGSRGYLRRVVRHRDQQQVGVLNRLIEELRRLTGPEADVIGEPPVLRRKLDDARSLPLASMT